MSRAYACLLAACSLFSWGQVRTTADIVFIDGNIYTVEDQQPKAQAMAVMDGRLLYVGTNRGAQAFADQSTRIVSLQGKTVVPGFIESHGHLLNYGHSLLNLDLSKAQSYQQLLDMVAAAVSKAKPGEWITGGGWHQDKWRDMPSGVRGFPSHQALSAISPQNPIYLRHASGHAVMVNAKAMEMAGFGAEIPEIDGGGEVIKDAQGNPTGILVEHAAALVPVPVLTQEQRRRALKLAAKRCLEQGITSFHDAGSPARVIADMHALAQNGELGLRLWVMLWGMDADTLEPWLKRGPAIDWVPEWLSVGGIKLQIDGALGSRGAWLLEPYLDDPGNSGHALMTPEAVYRVAKRAYPLGFQVCTHAIGDRANREVLDAYQRVFTELGQKDHRYRIEHAQHLHPDDISRFAELGVIASMQAVHCTSDRPWAPDRLGPQRIEQGAYVWKALLNSGAMIVNGTDVPVESPDTIANYYAAVTRQRPDGTPRGGFDPQQRMTRAQALRAYTLDAAFAAFEEDKKGSLKAGKLADFVVLSQDIMTIPEDDIQKTTIEATYVGGKTSE